MRLLCGTLGSGALSGMMAEAAAPGALYTLPGLLLPSEECTALVTSCGNIISPACRTPPAGPRSARQRSSASSADVGAGGAVGSGAGVLVPSPSLLAPTREIQRFPPPHEQLFQLPASACLASPHTRPHPADTWSLYASRLVTLSQVYSFWKLVTRLERLDLRRYLEVLYIAVMRPLVAKVGVFLVWPVCIGLIMVQCAGLSPSGCDGHGAASCQAGGFLHHQFFRPTPLAHWPTSSSPLSLGGNLPPI